MSILDDIAAALRARTKTRIYGTPFADQKLQQLEQEAAGRDISNQQAAFNLEEDQAMAPIRRQVQESLIPQREAVTDLTKARIGKIEAENTPEMQALKQQAAELKLKLMTSKDAREQEMLGPQLRLIEARINKANQPVRVGRPREQLGMDADGQQVIVDFSTGTARPVMGPDGTPLGKRLPIADRKAMGSAATIESNIDRMEELAAGPLVQGWEGIIPAGAISKLKQSIMGPSGAEGEFDFLADAVIDTIYQKTGAAMNKNEEATMRRMLPDRSRGNVLRQVQLFKNYANSLLSQYDTSKAKVTPGRSGAASSAEQWIRDPATGKLRRQ